MKTEIDNGHPDQDNYRAENIYPTKVMFEDTYNKYELLAANECRDQRLREEYLYEEYCNKEMRDGLYKILTMQFYEECLCSIIDWIKEKNDDHDTPPGQREFVLAVREYLIEQILTTDEDIDRIDDFEDFWETRYRSY